MAAKKVRLLCACQGEDHGEIGINFHYGLEGMGKETPYKIRIPAIGTLSDTYEDIKEKLSKIVKKVEKRQRKKHQKTNQSSSSADNVGVGTCDILSDTSTDNTNLLHDHNRLSADHCEETTERGSVEDLSTSEYSDKAGKSDIYNGNNHSNNENNTEKKLIKIYIKSGNQILSEDTLNSVALQTGNILTIAICGLFVEYSISFNPPQVDNLELPNTIMVGYSLYPKADFRRCNASDCDIKWFKCKEKPRKKISFAYKKLFFDSSKNLDEVDLLQSNRDFDQVEIIDKYEDNSSWELIGTGYIYHPNVKDIGHYIKVSCSVHGDRYNCQFSTESKAVVRPDPGPCPFETRHLHTQQESAHGSFRLLCYNILADKYANTRLAMDMFYPYCPRYALGLDYRKQLFMKEILGYNADFICLQEVDQKVFYHDLMPILGMKGYGGHLITKAKIISAGVAIFYNKSKFKSIGRHDRECSAALQEDILHKELLQKLSECQSLKERVVQAKAILKVEVFESIECPGKVILVANTHLKCGQKIPHWRIIQIAVMLKHIESILATKYSEMDVSVILCGDLNSLPESAVVQLLSKGKVSSNHADWFVGGRPDYISNMNIQTNLQLETAYKNPYYTNYVSGFYGTIDYIFHDRDKLEVLSTVPLPLHSEVVENTACPNTKFPSDHLALVCDMKWK